VRLDGTEIPTSFAAMRPLKPYLMALGGVITALFSVVFLGAHPGPKTIAPVTTPQPDLQSKTVGSPSEVVANRDAKPALKTPAPPLHSPTADSAGSETLRLAHAVGPSAQERASERVVDRRALSLVGIVELRI
jgi:hypothetical protein